MKSWPLPLRAGALFLGLLLLWVPVSTWVSYPAGQLAAFALEHHANGWVESTHNAPGALQARLRFQRIMEDRRIATPHATVNPAHYTYGNNLLLALLVATNGMRFWRRALLGLVTLLPFQALSLVSVILSQIIREVPPAVLKVSSFQLDFIAAGQLFGTLVMPTLAPVIVWVWLDRASIARLTTAAKPTTAGGS
jgi:hypothetical protein